ncbi:MAG TPA: D,D-dipeptide ABC transporter permease [Synergistaceae bacterium]|jgi:peptide/nickel transport system permease protein|nr:MAG: Oligopeptide ABC transporter, permease component [Synergistales bacterium 53_16]MDK2846595.1 peptide/nickel transport system permease protein [Synergistales bacterium]MDN5336750.1 peptide/nickel transport system permease protein [Synergistales bacterium]HAA46930.1 D,D-dipeptide ABC transporter permease [Synergistaceae bacterium]HAG22371.1 D,D-dipeptide ABC transporter permease [Synergistaceae bacterium]
MKPEKRTFARWKEKHESEISQVREIIHAGKRSHLTIAGLVIVLALVLTAILAPLLAPYDPLQMDLRNRLQAPSTQHWMGTDELGRDIFSRILHGTGLALKIMIIVLLIDLPLGMLLGIVAGYFGGWIDEVIMRTADIFMAFPRLVLAMAIGAALGPSLVNTMIAIAVTMWPTYARLARGETLSIKERTFIDAEKVVGTTKLRILFSDILPLCSSTAIIRATLDMGNVIRIAAGMSFIGLGAQPPTPEWGLMVSTGRAFLVNQWWVPTFPGLAILVTVFGFNLLGDGIRDIADPHLRRGD